jgi:hypothetical protein
MDIWCYFMNTIGSLSFANIIAILTVFVSALIAYYSYRANRISQRVDKRSEESKLNEKKSEGTRLLNESLMKLNHSKIYKELCLLSFGSLIDLSSKHFSETSKNRFEIDYEKTVKTIKDIGQKISEIELKIKECHEEIKEEKDLLKIDEKLLKADALDKEATIEFQIIQGINQDILEGVKMFRKVTFQKFGIDI